MSQAKTFYLVFTGVVAVAAGVVLIPNAPLGLVTLGVQALAGVLLPSASVFLLLLSNDRAVLGPWANPGWLNAVAGVIIGVLVMLSAILRGHAVSGHRRWPAHARSGIPAGCRTRRPWPHIPEIDEVEEIDRLSWQMPPLDELPGPAWSTARKTGVLVLRGYLVLAVLLVLGKVLQLALAGTGHA